MANKLNPYENLKVNESISSNNGQYTLKYFANGNLVLFKTFGASLWGSKTNGKPVGVCKMQGDGNLVIYGPGDDYQQLGSEKISSGPAACSWGPNRIDVFVRGTDDCLYTKSWYGAGWTGYTRLGAETFTGDPAACSWGPGRIDVFVRGTDDCLYTKSWDGTGWSDYTQLGSEKISSGPAACSWGPGRIDVFVRGTDDCLYTKSWDGARWSEYTRLGSEKFLSNPCAISWAPNKVDVFIRGTDDRLYTKCWDGTGWSNYTPLGPEGISSSPTACSWKEGAPSFPIYRKDVFVRGTDGKVYHKESFAGVWSGYVRLGEAEIIGAPSAVSWGQNRIDVFYAGIDNRLYTRWLDGVYWSGGYVWDTGTDGHPGSWLILQDDGNAVIYDTSNNPIWATDTQHVPPPAMTTVPSIVGSTLTQANAHLLAANLKLGIVWNPTQEIRTDYLVVTNQSPAAATSVPRNSSVAVYVALGYQTQGVKQITLYNCDQNNRTLHVWLLDATQNTWTEQGVLSADCSAPGAAHISMTLSQGHQYKLAAIDTTDPICSTNDPRICRKWETADLISGDSGGLILAMAINS